MADAFAASIAPAPEQWYSFKPVWPTDPRGGRGASPAGPRRWRANE